MNFTKHWIATVLYFVVIFACNSTSVLASEQENIKVVVVCKGLFDDGIEVAFPDQQPFIYQNEIMIPVRATMQMYRADVNYYVAGSTCPARVDIQKDGVNATFYVGKSEYETYHPKYEGGALDIVKHPMDVPTQFVNGTVVVPYKYIVEELGGNVTWDDKTNTITITDAKGYTKPELIVDYNDGYLVTIRNKYDTRDRLFRFVCTSNPGLNRWHTFVYSTGKPTICNEDANYHSYHAIYMPHGDCYYDEELIPGMIVTYDVFEKLPDGTERKLDQITFTIPSF